MKKPKINLTPKYDFDRKSYHRSIHVPDVLPKFFHKKTPCEKLYFENSDSLKQIPVHSVKASSKPLA